jgi:hypothetical protein
MTASARHVRRLLGGDVPQAAVEGLEESLAAASTDGLRVANAVAADYTLALSDLGKAVDVNSGTAKAVTVPPNSAVAYPVGALIEVHQVGAGAVSLTAGLGVTLEGSTTVPSQGSSLLLRKRATNTWTVTDLARSGTYVPINGDGLGGATASDQLLKDWAAAEAYEVTAATRDVNDLVTTATVKWPDGSGGTFTTTTANATFLTVDAYTVSHTLSGKTVTQAAVTRNGNGAVTVKPALTVA